MDRHKILHNECYLFISYCVESYINYKNTDNDWNHIRPASLDLNL